MPAKKQTVLITGASTGIGFELAKLFARDGFNLILVARNQDKLNQLAHSFRSDFGISAEVLPKDLSLSDSPNELFQEIQAKNLAVDILVNNAGFATNGEFAQTDLLSELELLQLNIVSLVHLCKLFLKDMLERKNGKILNVASTAAFQPGPLIANYYASKAYVLSFSEALANELKGSGVSVSVLCPGATKTEFQNRARMNESKLFRSGLMAADEVAKVAYEGLMNGEAVIIPGAKNKILAFAVRFIPRSLAAQIARFLNGK